MRSMPHSMPHSLRARRWPRAPRSCATFITCATATLAFLVGRGGVIGAQESNALRAGVSAHVLGIDSSKAKLYAPLASLVVPGAGQVVLGDNRFVGYAAAEIVGWFLYAKDRRDQSRQESAFKDLARQVARAHFSSAFPDAPWAYYEQLRDWQESGVYSQSGTALEPETDTLTYNGYKWQLALRTTETREEALAQYRQVAVRPEFQWSWQNAREQWTLYKNTTDDRNDANRAAVRMLSLVAANHILSMIDAFATFRLSVQPGPNGAGDGVRIGASFRW
jgi:hypothetical protein